MSIVTLTFERAEFLRLIEVGGRLGSPLLGRQTELTPEFYRLLLDHVDGELPDGLYDAIDEVTVGLCAEMERMIALEQAFAAPPE